MTNPTTTKVCPHCLRTGPSSARACHQCGFRFGQIIQPRTLQLTAAEYALAQRAVRR